MPSMGVLFVGCSGLTASSVRSNCSSPRLTVRVTGCGEAVAPGIFQGNNGLRAENLLTVQGDDFIAIGQPAWAAGLLLATAKMTDFSAGPTRICRRALRSYHFVSR